MALPSTTCFRHLIAVRAGELGGHGVSQRRAIFRPGHVAQVWGLVDEGGNSAVTANNDEPESVSRQNFRATCGRFAHSGVGMTEGGSMSMIGFSCPYCGHMNIEDTGIDSVERIDGRL